MPPERSTQSLKGFRPPRELFVNSIRAHVPVWRRNKSPPSPRRALQRGEHDDPLVNEQNRAADQALVTIQLAQRDSELAETATYRKTNPVRVFVSSVNVDPVRVYRIPFHPSDWR